MSTKIVTTNAKFNMKCWTTYIGAVQGVLDAAGWGGMETWKLMGMTGMAFHLIVHETCCPSSVTVYNMTQEHMNALDRIGVLSEVYSDAGYVTYEAAIQQAIVRIKESLDRGIAVITWGIGIPEFGIITGYDDEDGVFFTSSVTGESPPNPPLLYANVGRTGGAPFLHCQAPICRVPYDVERTYLDSLRFYVEQMEKPFHTSPYYQSGFLAYNNWRNTLAQGKIDDPHGIRYITTVYTEAKLNAAKYLRFLADTWQGLDALNDIAEVFAEIGRVYLTMLNTLECSLFKPTFGMPITPAQATAVLPLLDQAESLDRQAVAMVKRALENQKA